MTEACEVDTIIRIKYLVIKIKKLRFNGGDPLVDLLSYITATGCATTGRVSTMGLIKNDCADNVINRNSNFVQFFVRFRYRMCSRVMAGRRLCGALNT